MEDYTYIEQQKAHLALCVFDRKGDYPKARGRGGSMRFERKPSGMTQEEKMAHLLKFCRDYCTIDPLRMVGIPKEQVKAMLEEYKRKKGDYDRSADTAVR